MSQDLPLHELRDEVLRITLNRPQKLNALTPEIYAFIGDSMDRGGAATRAATPWFCAERAEPSRRAST